MARQKQAVSRLKAPVLGADETEVKLSGNGVTLGFPTDSLLPWELSPLLQLICSQLPPPEPESR
jgi:hypothetical protein